MILVFYCCCRFDTCCHGRQGWGGVGWGIRVASKNIYDRVFIPVFSV
jgi:hypothetical protein